MAEIREGAGPYKASVALSSPVFGYALGSLAADWLEGKSVPQAMDVLPVALTKDNLAQYEADLADPGSGLQRSRCGATPISRCTATSATTRATST